MEKENKNLNRIKVVLAEKNLQNKWLAEQIGRDQATVSKWVTNSAQPNLETLIKIAQVLKVEIGELVRTDQVAECWAFCEVTKMTEKFTDKKTEEQYGDR